MSGKANVTTRDERLDRLCGEVLAAVRVSEEEITATAGSSDSYEGLRLRIADIGSRTRRRTSGYERFSSFFASLVGHPRFLALATTAAILMLLAASLFVLLPAQSSTRLIAERKTEPITQPVPPTSSSPAQTAGHPEGQPDGAGLIHRASIQSASKGGHRKSVRRPYGDSTLAEVATDFLPLTFVDDSRAQESGHVVRVKVSRSALVAFGVPMNMERAGELITADVVVGDDGLARAIRFVQ